MGNVKSLFDELYILHDSFVIILLNFFENFKSYIYLLINFIKIDDLFKLNVDSSGAICIR